jgi:hypothetical protein
MASPSCMGAEACPPDLTWLKLQQCPPLGDPLLTGLEREGPEQMMAGGSLQSDLTLLAAVAATGGQRWRVARDVLLRAAGPSGHRWRDLVTAAAASHDEDLSGTFSWVTAVVLWAGESTRRHHGRLPANASGALPLQGPLTRASCVAAVAALLLTRPAAGPWLLRLSLQTAALGSVEAATRRGALGPLVYRRHAGILEWDLADGVSSGPELTQRGES